MICRLHRKLHRKLHSKPLSILMFMLLTGCGGSGTDGTLSGAVSIASGNQAKLAAAVQVEDGTTVGATTWADGSTANGGNGQAIEGLTCTLPGVKYSYAHLSILQGGKQLALPASIGVQAPTMAQQTGCVYPLHTDDASGKIRIDASMASPTLGQFFAIWGQSLSSSGVAGLAGPVIAYINDNGTLTQYNGDLSAIPLMPGREITLVAGTAPAEIPTYNWSDPPPLSTTPLVLQDQQIGTALWTAGDTSTGGQGQPVDGIQCGVMSEDYHVHAHLTIIKDGQQLAIPSQVGIPGNCNYAIHTHNESGELHVENPTVQSFTLGQFFDIWGRPLSPTNVADFTGQPIKFYINDNGDLRQYTGNPAAIALASHRSITIQIGAPPATIPTYLWDTDK